MTHCGFCGAPTLNGSLCKLHWQELQALLQRCNGLADDLASAVGKRGRYGEDTGGGGSSQPGLPINPDAMEARRGLEDVLCVAWRGLGLDGTPSSVDDAAGMILGRSEAVLASSVGPVLLGHLAELVPAAVKMTDRPRGRLSVQVPCPRCAGGPLQPVMGALQCSSCGELSTIGEVRAAS